MGDEGRPPLVLSGGDHMEEILSSGLQTAFSILVAAYLLVRMEARMEALTQAITELKAIIERM